MSGSSNGEERRGMEKEVQMSVLGLRSADEARRATEAIDEPICFNAKRGERERAGNREHEGSTCVCTRLEIRHAVVVMRVGWRAKRCTRFGETQRRG